MYDLARIRYVTEHYRDLQGLVNLPASLFFLGWAAYDLGWFRPKGWLANDWVLWGASLALLFGSMWGIGKLYERAFGWIGVDSNQKVSGGWTDFWLWYVPVMVAAVLAYGTQQANFLGLMLAIEFTIHWRRRRKAMHWLVVGVIMLLLSLKPVADGILSATYVSPSLHEILVKLSAALGIATIGTIDHLTLARTLGPIRREEESRA